MSRVTYHMSHVTHHFFFFFFWTKWWRWRWWRVCYQRGLSRLVSTANQWWKNENVFKLFFWRILCVFFKLIFDFSKMFFLLLITVQWFPCGNCISISQLPSLPKERKLTYCVSFHKTLGEKKVFLFNSSVMGYLKLAYKVNLSFLEV